jgi:hypothetical protein
MRAAGLIGKSSIILLSLNVGASEIPASQRPVRTDVELVSNTMGADLSPYVLVLHNDVQRDWEHLIPKEDGHPLTTQSPIIIRLTIASDGRVASMYLETKTGDGLLDRAAWGAIVGKGTYSPLPKDFHGSQLELRIRFFSNPDPAVK